MRRVPFIVLFLYAAAATALFFFASAYASEAHAGTLHFVTPSGLLSTNPNDASSGGSRRLAVPEALVNRSMGLDALADRLGISGTGLNFYEYTDRPGTSAEARFTAGVGAHGLLLRLVW